MARTQTDDPAPVKARVDPADPEVRLRRDGEEGADGKRPARRTSSCTTTCWSRSAAPASTWASSCPSVPYWGLPAFSAGSATSLSVVTKGSLVLDAMLPGAKDERRVIWRGMAESTVGDADQPATREARIREARPAWSRNSPSRKRSSSHAERRLFRRARRARRRSRSPTTSSPRGRRPAPAPPVSPGRRSPRC